ncbi:hypothetical protein [Paraburkholderia nemoris]|uniref:EF-hand domain-containing protein n=1 Tax=Paraburkholderia nemoris TaxID=2793076 RepID=A0ABN7N669_9BURK|nr:MULTISPECIES: hypothetical protein [Paraburkholderia]MBK3816162.1 hypothetical protein [Paraburkholderia aspalathi]CAE6855856.1 hypothetical protein R69776_07735 [Paraburkholderia nemoris]CAE6859650.1 hypothetical protein R75777_07975 [Paraburkholderia nemoris]
MHKPITSRLAKKQLRSVEELSRTLIKTYTNEFADIEARILSLRIGALNNGKPVWWEKRPQKLKCLLDFLELERDDLAVSRKSGRYTFEFSAFPGVPPLDLRREDIWEISELVLMQGDMRVQQNRYQSKPTLRYWLEGIGLTPGKIQWLQIEDAVEYQMLTRKLAAVGRHDIIFVKSLSDVLENDFERLFDPSPLILAIRDDVTAKTLKPFAIHRPDAPRLIVSPFPPPISGPRANSDTNADLAKLVDIESLAWSLKPNWRQSMLQWLDERMNGLEANTLFTSEAAQSLLDKFDPDGQWFVSVEEILILCQAIDEAKERKLQKAMESNGNASVLLELLLGRNESQSDLIEQLIAARWKRWDLPWMDGVAVDDWRVLSNNLCEFDALLERAIIAPSPKGYDFANPIVARLLLRNYLFTVLRTGETTSWAPACFDAQRRPMLDAALDAVPIEVLENLSERIMQDQNSVGVVGAVEALFVAIGRRIIRSEPVSDELGALTGHILNRISNEHGLAIPLSRSLATPEAQLEWTSVCWAWSLATAPVKGWTQSWLFPGWRAALPEKLDDWLNVPGRHGHAGLADDWTNLAVPMQRFLSVVERWTASLDKPLLYEYMPSVFRLAFLAHAAAGKWQADRDWWHGVFGEPAAEQALLDLMAARGTSLDAFVARVWWPSLIRHLDQCFGENSPRWQRSIPDGFGGNANVATRSSIFARVMERLEPTAGEALLQLDGKARHFLSSNPGLLSPPFKRALLKLVTGNEDFSLNPWEIPSFLSRFGPETAPELESLLSHDKLGQVAARHLWEWRPSEADRLMRKKRALSPMAMKHLVLSCPVDAIAIAIAQLQKEPEFLSLEERRQWVYYHLPDSRQHANALLQLL